MSSVTSRSFRRDVSVHCMAVGRLYADLLTQSITERNRSGESRQVDNLASSRLTLEMIYHCFSMDHLTCESVNTWFQSSTPRPHRGAW